MIEKLGVLKLRTGEEMVVKLIIPPAQEYEDRISHFLVHKRENTLRDIKQRLKGDYIKYCIDKYFIGEINGNVVGHIWYGYTIDTGIGNFGHVYTSPEHRKKGITNELMKFVVSDFNKSPAKALFCGTGRSWVADIYIKYGFQLVKREGEAFRLTLIKKEYASNFEDLEKKSYKPGFDIKVIKGSIRERHDVDKLLENSLLIRGVRWDKVAMSYHVPSYREAYFMVEDKKGIVTVAETSDGSIVGWSFILNTGSEFEDDSKIFDFIIHPNYSSKTRDFIKKSLKLAKNENIKNIYSYMPSYDSEKINNLINEGFVKVASIADYCKINDKTYDLVILKY